MVLVLTIYKTRRKLWLSDLRTTVVPRIAVNRFCTIVTGPASLPPCKSGDPAC